MSVVLPPCGCGAPAARDDRHTVAPASLAAAAARAQPAARCLLAWCLLALALLASWLPGARAEEDFLPPEQAFAFSAAMVAPDALEVRFRIAPGYYMYRERFAFAAEPAGAIAGDPVFPRGEVKYDPTFEKDMEVYHDGVAIRLPLAAVDAAVALTVTSQGCADAGLCYPPMQSTARLLPAGAGYEVDAGAPQRGAGTLQGWLQAGDTGLAQGIADSGWLQAAGVFFVLGLLLSLTPCVLPMVPILSALILGRGGGQDAVHPASRWRGLGLAAAYVLGMSVVYTAVGIAAGLSGLGLAAWLQTPWVLGLFAALLALFALAMFDVYTLQLPAGLQSRLSERAARIPGGRAAGALLMGAVSALIVGPCVAAPLAGALLYISQTRDVVLGGAALFAMAWGMGVPLLLVGASSGALLPRAGAWMETVKRLFGLLLLATAWWMLMPVLASWAQMLGWALLAAFAAVLLRAFEPLPQPAGLARMAGKALGLFLALLAVVLVVGVASGGRDPLQPLSHLAGSGRTQAGALAGTEVVRFTRIRSSAELDAVLARADRPVMLDFYADWCVACKEMERFTFSDPAVAAQMSRMLLLQADVTANDAQDRELLRRFRLFGPPGIVFFAPGGRELPERVVGFQGADRFGAVLTRVLGGETPPAMGGPR